LRYLYVLTYRPIRDPVSKDNRQGVAGGHSLHKIRIELQPREKFERYSAPYYKRAYRSVE